MTSIIDDKIYELITKNENFEFAYDIRQRFDNIQIRIWDEFWADFQQCLKREYENFQLKEDIDDSYIFDFYPKSWKKSRFYFDFSTDNLKYGVELDNVGNKKQIQKIRTLLSDILGIDELEQGDKIYFSFDNNIVFDSSHNLKKVLPENRSTIISQFISEFRKIEEAVSLELNNFEIGFVDK